MAGRPKKLDQYGLPPAQTGIKRGKYKKQAPIEPRGEQKNEFRVQKAFWRKYTMDQIIVMTSEELDKAIDNLIEEFAARQIKGNPRWWYPESPKDNYQKIRNHKIPGSKFN